MLDGAHGGLGRGRVGSAGHQDPRGVRLRVGGLRHRRLLGLGSPHREPRGPRLLPVQHVGRSLRLEAPVRCARTAGQLLLATALPHRDVQAGPRPEDLHRGALHGCQRLALLPAVGVLAARRPPQQRMGARPHCARRAHRRARARHVQGGHGAPHGREPGLHLPHGEAGSPRGLGAFAQAPSAHDARLSEHADAPAHGRERRLGRRRLRARRPAGGCGRAPGRHLRGSSPAVPSQRHGPRASPHHGGGDARPGGGREGLPARGQRRQDQDLQHALRHESQGARRPLPPGRARLGEPARHAAAFRAQPDDALPLWGWHADGARVRGGAGGERSGWRRGRGSGGGRGAVSDRPHSQRSPLPGERRPPHGRGRHRPSRLPRLHVPARLAREEPPVQPIRQQGGHPRVRGRGAQHPGHQGHQVRGPCGHPGQRGHDHGRAHHRHRRRPRSPGPDRIRHSPDRGQCGRAHRPRIRPDVGRPGGSSQSGLRRPARDAEGAKRGWESGAAARPRGRGGFHRAGHWRRP
mmetsp:Transcript_25466/g.74786  ORF Transcript_25466/g.74786 Transcript_25466/m.74786 type:complete len:521 (-) Transcript_25466:230-1792(-)